MSDWSSIRAARILITGGTGFLGTSILEAFFEGRLEHQCDAELVVLTRDPEAFRLREPVLASRVRLIAGDVRSFPSAAGEFTHIIHAAAQPNLQSGPDVILRGTLQLLDVARRSPGCRMLFVSSGAVYGPQPPDLSHLPESHVGEPATPYGIAKRTAERSCLDSPVACVIARCFSFIGPRIPLDGPFAAGNFIRDAIAGRDVEIKGDGTDIRGYLDTSDCADWLWTLLLHGRDREAYNVGSDHAVSIAELAHLIADSVPAPVGVRILRQHQPGVSHRYLPCIDKIRGEFALSPRYVLREAIARAVAAVRTRVAADI
jgi:dTDP-glucose 4,6-dehydratase